ncbi:hypothetical protein ACKKBF_B40565 [Auxenochlorella protothecoides x Auxenochlorella symbiontica]
MLQQAGVNHEIFTVVLFRRTGPHPLTPVPHKHSNPSHPHQNAEQIDPQHVDAELVTASEAGTSRRRGKEPVPEADPSLDITPDQATTPTEPDNQGPAVVTPCGR